MQTPVHSTPRHLFLPLQLAAEQEKRKRHKEQKGMFWSFTSVQEIGKGKGHPLQP